MAVLANIPLVNARILIHDAGQLGLKSLYERAKLPPELLFVVRAAVDVLHETEMDGNPHDLERYRARAIERILTKCETMEGENVDYLLNKLGDVLRISK